MIMPSKTEDASAHSLADSINAATRSTHTKLNKLIISRLRLALPPLADDASHYVSGLLHITPIYATFESLWKSILDESGTSGADHGICDSAEAHPDDCSDDCADDCLDTGTRPLVDPRIRSLLADSHFESLQRSRALEEDLIALTFWSKRTLTERLHDASESPVLSNFLAHTKSIVRNSPHTLLAYAWVLYMALFSGGRYIRSSLENIYPAFWIPASAQRPAPAALAGMISTESQPLRFFRFDTPADGEDLKAAFKKRLFELENVLTELEREEIVREACCIFEYMIELVGELDDVCGAGMGPAEARLLSLRSRDSLVVENDRRQQFAEKLRGAATKAAADCESGESGERHVKFY